MESSLIFINKSRLTKLLIPAEVWGARGDEREEQDEQSQDPAETTGHEAGPRREVKPGGADDGPSVESQGHLDQQQS